MPADDKRRAARERHDSVLEIFEGDGERIAWTCTLVNYSDTGACFTSTRELRPGDTLRGRLRLLNKGALNISAHVVWRRGCSNFTLYGVKFDSVTRIYQSDISKRPL